MLPSKLDIIVGTVESIPKFNMLLPILFDEIDNFAGRKRVLAESSKQPLHLKLLLLSLDPY